MTRQAGELNAAGSAVGAASPRLSRGRQRTIPEATVARLAVYLRVLTERRPQHRVQGERSDGGSVQGERSDGGSVQGERGDGASIVSSADLAASAGVNPAGLRRDLSFLGSHGVRGVGYDVDTLIEQIQRVLGAHHRFRVALVGIGNLGQALAGYAGFGGRGLRIGALFDVDPEKIGRSVAGLTVRDLADAPRICPEQDITIGVIATPESAAQSAADVLVSASIFSILNFAPGNVVVPAGVEVRRVDLALELQMLAFHETTRVDGAVAR